MAHPGGPTRSMTARDWAWDAITAFLLTVAVFPLWWRDVAPIERPGVTILIVVAMGTGLVIRRAAPLACACWVFGIGALQLMLGVWIIVPGDALVLVALYGIVALGPRWAAAIALAASLIGTAFSTGGYLMDQGGYLSTSVLVYGGAMTACALVAFALGVLRRSHDESRVSARRVRSLTELERSRAVELATAAERARIAREMHDVVAHSLSIVIAQADGGRYQGAKDPAAAIAALDTISLTGRAALADMRKILGVLRPAEDQADMAPQPDVASIEQLVASVREAGLDVSLAELGQPRPLPPGIGLSVYRIAQEALTNVLKHAGPGAKADVQLRWQPAAIELVVIDDGRGAAAPSESAGQGLTGMRQRAEMFGGSVNAGPRPGGGFRVEATMPTPPPGGRDDEVSE